MQKLIILFTTMLLLIACEADYRGERQETYGKYPDTLVREGDTILEDEEHNRDQYRHTYGNDRFRNVTVQRLANEDYLIQGEARVTEANVNYVVEDGHNELKSGYTTASTAGPEWGTFEFRLNVKPRDKNRALMLVLFEESMEDGSRVSELPIRLDQPSTPHQ